MPPIQLGPPTLAPPEPIILAQTQPRTQTQPNAPIQPRAEVITLDTLLVKDENESEDIFIMRNVYSRAAMKIFNNQINPATAILIGQMATNKAIYGVTYPEESERVLIYVNNEIAKNPQAYHVI